MAEKSQKRGLGTGLGALFGESIMGNELEGAIMVPVSKVEPRADQPRKSFDEDAMQELADSISRFGMIQPITVRKLEGGYYQIIAGERRWRASRLAGLNEVPVRVIEADDKRATELALVENLQREDLNPIEEARGFRVLMEEYGMTQEEAAKSVGKSRPAVANSLRLLSLSPELTTLVEDGDISAGHARALLVISDTDLRLDTAKKVIEEGLSVRQTEKIANRLADEERRTRVIKETKPEEDDPLNVDYVADIERQLGAALGRKVYIRDKRKKGKIELEYYGAEDREALISALISFADRKR